MKNLAFKIAAWIKITFLSKKFKFKVTFKERF